MKSDLDTEKWYKQFWPWFLIFLPMTAVVGSMFTIKLAVTDSDGLVKDDYYKQGLAMNQDLARKKTAEDLGVLAQGTINADAGSLLFALNDAAVGHHNELSLSMIHPTRSDNDMTILLSSSDFKNYSGTIPQAIKPGYWWIRLSPVNDSWYIEGRIRLPEDQIVHLK